MDERLQDLQSQVENDPCDAEALVVYAGELHRRGRSPEAYALLVDRGLEARPESAVIGEALYEAERGFLKPTAFPAAAQVARSRVEGGWAWAPARRPAGVTRPILAYLDSLKRKPRAGVLAVLARLPALRWAEVRFTRAIDAEAMAALKALGPRCEVGVHLVGGDGEGIAALGELGPRLRSLALDGSRHKGSLDTLAALGSLRRLSMDFPSHLYQEFARLGRLRELSALELRGLPFCGAIARGVARISSLEALALVACRGLRPAEVDELRALPRLRRIAFANDGQLQDEQLIELSRLPSLESVAICGLNTPLTGSGLALLASCPKLRAVELGGLPRIDDAGLLRLAAAPRLEELTIGLQAVSVEGVAELARRCGLRRVLLRGDVMDAARLRVLVPALEVSQVPD